VCQFPGFAFDTGALCQHASFHRLTHLGCTWPLAGESANLRPAWLYGFETAAPVLAVCHPGVWPYRIRRKDDVKPADLNRGAQKYC
jgi:hypothetical protein